ncbi:hypothetical protein [Halorientalis salina]|uniref:hypothetical protein n=1 Tax=Halorientalis salina TaxID=2932266 RepID=UPI0010ACF19C|nr:hypothetical protein [Halorientalis salina]
MRGALPSSERLFDSDQFGVIVVGLAVLAFAIGYAGGSVLAGESIGQQFWLLAVILALGAALLALSHDESDDKK